MTRTGIGTLNTGTLNIGALNTGTLNRDRLNNMLVDPASIIIEHIGLERVRNSGPRVFTTLQ